MLMLARVLYRPPREPPLAKPLHHCHPRGRTARTAITMHRAASIVLPWPCIGPATPLASPSPHTGPHHPCQHLAPVHKVKRESEGNVNHLNLYVRLRGQEEARVSREGMFIHATPCESNNGMLGTGRPSTRTVPMVGHDATQQPHLICSLLMVVNTHHKPLI
jgi:hypothetical protein